MYVYLYFFYSCVSVLYYDNDYDNDDDNDKVYWLIIAV